MKKTVITAATATLSAGLIALAAVASAGGPSSPGTAEVSSTSPASTTVEQVHHGADDPLTHDVGDDPGSGGHGADDVAVTPAPAPAAAPTQGPAAAPAVTPARTASGRNGADDPATHDVGDDH